MSANEKTKPVLLTLTQQTSEDLSACVERLATETEDALATLGLDPAQSGRARLSRSAIVEVGLRAFIGRIHERFPR